MGKISKYSDGDKVGYHFHCPGCGSAHGVFVSGSSGPIWGFNNDLDKPTFTPSILVQYPHSSEERNKKAYKFKGINGRFPTLEELPHDKLDRCHSFVTDGKIRFLNDCTHHLKGQTVELGEF